MEYRRQRMGIASLVIASGLTLGGCKAFSTPPVEVGSSNTLATVSHNTRGVIAQFFGTSTILLKDGERAIMIDGFFSRPGPFQLLLTKLKPDEGRINAALVRGRVGSVDALLVAHSHYDHAMDAPIVARKTGALLIGSKSTANIAHGAGVAQQDICIIDSSSYGPAARLTSAADGRCPLDERLGKFRIRFFDTPHAESPFSFMELPGDIAQPLPAPAHAARYRVGRNYTFHIAHDAVNVLIVPSANLPLGLDEGTTADVVFLSIGLLKERTEDFMDEYWREAVVKTKAKLVIPIHWDRVTDSLEQPLRPLPYVLDNMKRTIDVLQKRSAADGVPIRFMPVFDPVLLTR